MDMSSDVPKYELVHADSDELVEARESLMERTERVLTEPGFMDKIYDSIAMGGNLADIAEVRNIRYSALCKFVNSPINKEQMIEALDMRRQYMADKLFNETAFIAGADIRKLFNPDGTMKNPSDWPEDIARAVDNIEVKELISSEGEKTGELKRVKLSNKLTALKMMGQEVKMFVEKKEHDVSDDLKAMIENSYKQEKEVFDAKDNKKNSKAKSRRNSKS